MIWTDLQNMSELFLRNFCYLNQIYKPDSIFPYSYKPTDTCQPKKKIESIKK